jgi:hypothetical protein
VLAFSRVLLLVWLALVASIPFALPKMQVSRDFAAFWTAARLAADGQAAAAYGEASLAGLAALFGPGTYPPFFYPPTALLLWLPFSALGFVAAASVWVALTLALYAMSLRAMEASLVTAMAFPSVLFCALYGQNALFSAALFATAAVLLNRAPVLAGMLLGVFIYKPQLAILVPLALAISGHWRAFFATAVTAAVLIALSVLAFGAESWRAFRDVLPAAQHWNETGVPGFQTFASPYAALRLLGFGADAGWIAQGVLALVAVICLIVAVRRRPASVIAITVVATAFWMPFIGQYDVAIMAVPAAWLVADAQATRWLPYEPGTLALLFLSPIAIIAAGANGVPLGPLALASLLALVTRRATLTI